MQPMSAPATRKSVLGLVALGLAALVAVLTLVALVMFLATAGKFSGNNEDVNDFAGSVILGAVAVDVVTFVLSVIATILVASARKRGTRMSYAPGLVAMALSAVPMLVVFAGIVYSVAAGGAAR